MVRRLVIACLVVALGGCASDPPAPPPIVGPAAEISDSAVGGGFGGGTFYFLSEINGQPTTSNSFIASLRATQGRGMRMQLSEVSRRVPAGLARVKLSRRFAYAAPIQSMFQSDKADAVDGEFEVALRPDVDYVVRGSNDVFRPELWLEERATGQRVGSVLARAVAAPALAPKDLAQAAFTCCNLRYSGDWIGDANSPDSPFVPAGSQIIVKDYGRYRANVLIEGRAMRIGQDYGREQQTREQHIGKLVVKDDPKLRLATFDAQTQQAIRAGRVQLGMTREQVLMALSYPRADLTRSLDLPTWTYLADEEESLSIVWGPQQTVVQINASEPIRQLLVFPPP